MENQAPAPESAPQVTEPKTSQTPQSSRKKALMAGIAIFVFGILAYILSSSTLFKGSFIPTDEDRQKAVEEIAGYDSAQYSMTTRISSETDGRKQDLTMIGSGTLNFKDDGGGIQHTITFSGTGSQEDEDILNLTAAPNGEEVDIAWNDMPEDSSSSHKYKLYRSQIQNDLTNPEFLVTQSEPLLNNTFGPAVKKYTDVLQSGGTFYYTLLKVSDADETKILKKSGIVQVSYEAGSAPVQENITITSVAQDVEGITITWTDAVPDTGANYEIYRFDGSEVDAPLPASAPIFTLTTKETTYKDTGVQSGKIYHYVVRKNSATSPLAQSGDSEAVTFSGAASKPKTEITLKLTDTSGSSLLGFGILLNDLQTVPDDAKFILYRAGATPVSATPERSEQKKDIAKSDFSGNALLISVPKNGPDGTYYYSVMMQEPDGTSIFSNDEKVEIQRKGNITITKAVQNATGGVDLEWTDDTAPPEDSNWAYYLGISQGDSGWYSESVGQNQAATSSQSFEAGKTYSFQIKKTTPTGDPVYGQSAPVDVTITAPVTFSPSLFSIPTVHAEEMERKLYTETIFGTGTLTENKKDDGLTGEVTITDTYKSDTQTIVATLVIAIRGNKLPDPAHPAEITFDREKDENDTALDFLTEDFLQKNIATGVGHLLEGYENNVTIIKNGIRNNLSPDNFVAVVGPSIPADEVWYESGKLEKFVGNDMEFQYPEKAEDQKITIVMDGEKKLAKSLSGFLKYNTGTEFSFIVEKFKKGIQEVREIKDAAPVTPAAPAAPSGGGGGGGGGGGIAVINIKKPDVQTKMAPVVSLFDDVKSNSREAEAINALARENIISGNIENGKKLFKPNKPVNRAEIAKIILNASCATVRETAQKGPSLYVDVSEKEWYFGFSKEAYLRGFITGYKVDDKREFRGGNIITQGELVKIIVEVLRRGNFIDMKNIKKTEPWYRAYIDIAQKLDAYWADDEEKPAISALLNANEVNPTKGLMRKDAAVLLYRMHQLYGSCAS